MNTTKITYRDISKNYGKVYIHHWEKSVDAKYAEFLGIDNPEPEKRCLVFFPVKPVDNGMRCSRCGYMEWNASNFGNLIHFCPDRVMQVEITDYSVITQ